jgi:hypothetical protein
MNQSDPSVDSARSIRLNIEANQAAIPNQQAKS